MKLIVEPWQRSLADWTGLHPEFKDQTIFQTPEWLSFVAETQHGSPVLAVLRQGSRIVGYFSGLIVNKFGLRILGSPMPGWTTSYMGLSLFPEVSRCLAIRDLIQFAFDEWGCVHVELMDRHLSVEDAVRMGYAYRRFSGFEIDLTLSIGTLFDNMTSACRRCIRRATKTGVIIEEASDPSFAADFYSQLQEVFRKRLLVPPYGVDRVKALIAHLFHTGQLLLLRARDPFGRCIATGIFPAKNDAMYFWGGASRRDSLGFRPNEALQWYAMRYWKARGIRRYDMGGGGEYKRKFGGYDIAVPWIRRSKYPGLAVLRGMAKRMFGWRQRFRGRAVAYGRV